jgi:hypothetical protein
VLSTRRGPVSLASGASSHIYGDLVSLCPSRGVAGMPSLYCGLTRRGGRADLLRGGAHNTLVDGGLCHSMGLVW